MITSLEWSECRQTCKTKFIRKQRLSFTARVMRFQHMHIQTRAQHTFNTQLSHSMFCYFPSCSASHSLRIRWHYFSVAVYIQNECCPLWTNDDNCGNMLLRKKLLLPVYRCEYCVYVYNNMVIHTRKQTASHTQSPLRSVAGFRIKHFLKLAQRHHTSENGIDDENFVKKGKKSHTR